MSIGLVLLAICVLLILFSTAKYVISLAKSREGFIRKTLDWIEKVIDALF